MRVARLAASLTQEELSARAVSEPGSFLYAGEQQLSFRDRMTALPMAALWTFDGAAS